MVAYSFKPQFVAPIQAGTKIGTIRAPRSLRSPHHHLDRHAYPAEPMTLLTGPRMRPTEILRTTCAARYKVTMRFLPIVEVIHDGEKLPAAWLDAFAIEDGFADFGEIERFWAETHKNVMVFEGVRLCWRRSFIEVE